MGPVSISVEVQRNTDGDTPSTLTTTPVHPHKNLSDARETAICNFTGITHIKISEKDFLILLSHKKGEI